MATAPSKTATRQATTTGGVQDFVSDSLATGVIFALVLTVVQRIVGFLRNILFCKMMSVEQLGEWSMVFSFLMLLAPLAVVGLPGSFSRFVEHYRKKGQLETFVRRVFKLSAVLTFLLMTLMLIFPGVFSEVVFRDGRHIAVIYCMAITLVFVVGLNFLQSLMEAMRQFRVVTMMRFTAGIMFAVAGTGLMFVWNDMTTAATVGFAISCACGSRRDLVFLPLSWCHTRLWPTAFPFTNVAASCTVCDLAVVCQRVAKHV